MKKPPFDPEKEERSQRKVEYTQKIMEKLSKDNYPSYASTDVLTDVEKQIIEIGFDLYEKKLKHIEGLVEYLKRYEVKSYEADNGY